MNIAESEATETQTWIGFAAEHQYIANGVTDELNDRYEEVLRMLAAIINQPEKWELRLR